MLLRQSHYCYNAGMKETMVNTTATYTLERDGKLVVVEHVPARVCVETGEQFFAPETVEHLQSLINGEKTPARVIETPVYEYA
jgi:YgiT-type zinc finger domain-containing protein